MISSGQPCEKCRRGYYVVLDSFVKGTRRIQYLGCRRCGHRPAENKRSFPAEQRSPKFLREK